MNEGKKELLMMRGQLQNMIEKLNNDLIRNNPDYDGSKPAARDVRDLLIDADNRINEYRLQHVGV